MSPLTDKDSPAQTSSELPTGAERFLSRVAQHTTKNGWQSPEDFVRHFGPQSLMQALAKADTLRSRLLIELANVHEKIAVKKSIDSAAEDLRLALEEGITTPQAVLEQFGADDQVRYLKPTALFSYLFEDAFYRATDDAKKERAVARLAFLIEVALSENLLTLAQMADGIGFEVIAEHLPPAVLKEVVVGALQGGRQKEPLTEQRLLEMVPLVKLLGCLPLEVVWSRVIIERVAKPSGFVDGAAADALAPPSGKVSPAESSKTAPTDASQPQIEVESEDGELLMPSVESAPMSSPVHPEDEVRTRTLGRLREIERLPPRVEELSTPLLMSIESMYADLFQASTDEERAEAIRDSFPNETHLRSAMLALAELLEPSIDVTRPPISDADTDALVKLVVFEERKRKEGDGGTRRSSLRPPPLPLGRSASSVPAAARAPAAPPPMPGKPGRGD